MPPFLRPARRNDAEDVLALWALSEAAPTHTDDVASLERLIGHDSGALIVAEDDGRLVGSVIAGWDGWRGSVYRLVVAPSHRRAGLATRPLAEAEDRLRGLGAMRLGAIVVESDISATGFWRASRWHEQTDRLRFTNG